MKKFYLVLLTLAFALILGSCNKTTAQAKKEANPPSIYGAKDVTLTVGDKFRPIDGITAKAADGTEISTDDISYSGNVDTNTPGTYKATYTVTDKDGNTQTVTITVTVVAKDEEGPLLTGAGDQEIIVTTDFDPKAGVSANDTVDGDLTSSIVITGTVDSKHLGTYELSYKVVDKSGNETVKVRKITVSTGAFLFSEDEKSELTKVSATIDSESKYPYGLIKVNYTTTEANKTVKVTLGTYSVETTHAEAGTYFQYLKYTEAIADQDIAIENATFVSYIIGDAADVTAPVITGDFTNAVSISKDHKDAACQFIIDMCGVKARDDRDGYITSKLTLNTEGINWDSKAEQTAKLEVLDLAGNKGEKEVKVIVNQETVLADFFEDLEAIAADGTVDNCDYANYFRNGTLSKVTQDGTDKGAVKIGDLESGGYWSYGMVRYNLTDLITSGNYYVLKITARVGLEESEGQLTQGISFRIGGQLAADPWYYEFEGCSVGGSTYGENRISLTSEYQTIYRVFKADYRDSSANPEDVIAAAMEFHLTPQEWVTVYPVYIKEFSISLLSNEDQAPVLKQDSSKSTILVVGDTVDLSKYFTASDVEDGALTVSYEGTVDTSKKGVYPVKFSATDSKGNKTETTINFEVLTEKDESVPEIKLTQDLADDYLINELTTDQVKALLPTILKITDTKNGESYDIPVADAKINYGTLDMSKAGKYKVTVTAKDSSGNEGKLEIVVKVVAERTKAETNDELVYDMQPSSTPKAEGGIHTIENVTVTVEENIAKLLPTTFDGGWYGSFNKMKYDINGKMEAGKTYKLILEAKADKARDIKFAIVANWEYTIKSEVIGLTVEYAKYEITIEYTGKYTKDSEEKTISSALDCEFQIGWDSAFTGDCSTSNVIYVKSFGLYEVVEEGKVTEVKYDALKNGNFYSTGSLPEVTVNQDGSITFTAAANKWYGLNTLSVPTDCKYVVFTVSASESIYTEFKVDNSSNGLHDKRSKVTIPAEKTTYVIDLEAIGCNDASTLVKLCFTQYSKDITYTIYEAYFTNIEPEE